MRLEENAFRNKFDWQSFKLYNRSLKTDFKNFANLWTLEMSIFNSEPYKSLTSSRPFPVIRSQASATSLAYCLFAKFMAKFNAPQSITSYLRPVGTALAFDGRRLFRYKSSTLFAKLVFLPSLWTDSKLTARRWWFFIFMLSHPPTRGHFGWAGGSWEGEE